MPTTSLGLRYPAGSATPNVAQYFQDLATDVNSQLLIGTRFILLQRPGTTVDTYTSSAGLLAGTWTAAPQGAYVLSATLAVQGSVNMAGSVVITAGGQTLTKASTRADVPADTVTTLQYNYPFIYAGGNMAVALTHSVSGGTASVYNSNTQLHVQYLGRTA